MRRVVIGITVLAAALVLGFIKRTWTDGDEGRYLALARSVSMGEGQTLLHLPAPEPEFLTPPGYVWTLGLLDRATHGNLTALRLFSVIAFVISVWIFARFAADRSRLDALPLACALIIGLFSVQSLAHGWMIMTETPYLAVAALVLLLAARLENRPTRSIAFAVGALCGWAMLIRPAGMALVPAALAVLVLRRAWKEIGFLLLGLALCYSPAVLRSYHLAGVPFPHMTHLAAEKAAAPGGGPLHNILASFPGYFFEQLPAHLFYSLFDYRCLLCLLRLEILVRPLSIAIACVIAIGFLSRLRRPGMAEFYWIFAWPFLCAYNQPDYAAAGIFFFQPRYLIPILPLAGLYLVEGFRVAFNAIRLPRAYPVAASLCAAYVLLAAGGAAAARIRNEWPHRHRHDFDPARQLALGNDLDRSFGRYIEAAQWLGSNAPPNAVVASRKPEHVWLFSGLKGFRYDGADTHATGSVWDILMRQTSHGPLYILQDAFPADTGYGHARAAGLDPAIAEHVRELDLIHETAEPVTRIWRWRTTPAP